MPADGAASATTEAEALSVWLRGSLGPFGYQWLCACAVYPRLRFSLSGHLGNVLAETLGRPPVSEDEMLALYSLPWFRQGWLPTALRERLLADIDPRVLAAARGAIERVMFAAATDGEGDLARDPVALEAPPAGWGRELRSRLDMAPVDAVEHDPTFVRAMRRQSIAAPAVAREQRVRRALGDWAAGLLRWQTGAVMAVAGGLVAAWASADAWMEPMFQRQATVTQYVAAPPPTPLPEPAQQPAPTPSAPEPKPEPPKLVCPDGMIIGRVGATEACVRRPAPVPTCSRGQVLVRGRCQCPAGMALGRAGTRAEGFCVATPTPAKEPAPNPPADSSGQTPDYGPEQSQAAPSDERRVVMEAQRALADAGYKTPADGINGPATRTALLEFQRMKGLPATGDLNAQTLDALGLGPMPTAK